MSIARDISRQTSRQTATLTANQTSVTVTGGFSGSSIDVYLNGARIVQGQDYSLNGTSGITLTQGASAGDIIEFVIRNTSNSGFSAADTGQIVDGAVTFDKLSNSSTETQNVQQRTAAAWVNFNGTFGSSPFTLTNGGIRQAFNVSSVTDLNTGQYRINFNTAFSAATYCVTVGIHGMDISNDMFLEVRGSTTTYLDVWSWASNLGGTRDSPIVCVAVFGD